MSTRSSRWLFNHLSHAVKFALDGRRVVITTGLNDGEVQVTVWDTGIGISPKDQRRIFEEFQQVEGINTREPEGTGLGLAPIKQFAALHGGRLWVDREVGQGSLITFPLLVRTAPRSGGFRHSSEAYHSGSRRRGAGEGLRPKGD